MSKITNWIAKLGVQPWWIAGNAHCWFAFAVVYTSHHWWVALIAVALAAAKEFYFDATYEVPKQIFEDNLSDFTGYSLGITLGLLAMKFLP